MSKEKQPARLRKVFLPVMMVKITSSAVHIDPLDGEELSHVIEEYEYHDEHGQLSDDLRERMVERGKRGTIIDYRSTLIGVIGTPLRERMDYNEMEQIRPIREKLRAATPGTFVLLEEGEFKMLCERIKKPIYPHYNEGTDRFITDILDSEKVEVAEVVTSTEE